jgi:drug/metabolite transporter (DMT)-like permease
VNTGVSHFALKAFRESPDGGDQQAAFITLLFSTATVGGLALLRVPRGEPAGREWTWGTVVGLFNIGGTHGMVSALSVMNASQAFPLNTIAGIVLTTIGAVVLFGERLGPAAIVGLILSAASGVMIRL